MDDPTPGPGRRGSVLVTGGSVAGPAAAFWLSRTGWDVTVLEQSDRPREGGQNIDVRGLAKEVLDRMGLTEAVRAAGTGEQGTRFVDEDGATIAELPVAEDGGDGPTAELEILRDELSRVLVEACSPAVTWRYGDRVEAVAQDDAGVRATLGSGEVVEADLLVVAEGAGSRTRDLVMRGADVPELKRLGMYMTWGTIPRTDADDGWWRWLSVPGARSATLRPDNVGTTRATLAFMSEDRTGFERLGRDGQLADLRRRFGDLGWETPRILDGLTEAEDLYVEDLTQVMCPTWSTGRVCLLGDAAWCVTPIAGGGTSLALTGAYVLAASLARAEARAHPGVALTEYEDWMRPLVEETQDLPPGTPGAANPRSRLGVGVFRTVVKVAASRPARAVAERFTHGPDTDRELPDLVG